MRTPHTRIRLRACSLAKRQASGRLNWYIAIATRPDENTMARNRKRLSATRKRVGSAAVTATASAGMRGRYPQPAGSARSSVFSVVNPHDVLPPRESLDTAVPVRILLVSPTHYNADGSLHQTTRYW